MRKQVSHILSILLATACLANLSGCTVYRGMTEREMMLNLVEYTKMSFCAEFFCFWSTVGDSYFILGRYSIEENTRCVFVYSEAESRGYPNNVVVAWPTEDTERVLDRLNRYIDLNDIDLGEYNLSYPITIEDVVERWDLVYSVLVLCSNEIRHDENGLPDDDLDDVSRLAPAPQQILWSGSWAIMQKPSVQLSTA